MSDEFNPYREWLGLEVPAPNCYELLGLSPHETEATKIVVAADRAIARVRSFRPGPHARAWSRLLDELRVAKECLTDAGTRSRYDAELATGLLTAPILPPEAEVASPSELEPVPLPLPVPVPIESLPKALPIARQLVSPISTVVSRQATRTPRRGAYGWGTVAVIFGLALVVAALTYRLREISRQSLPQGTKATVPPSGSQTPLVQERPVEQPRVAAAPVESAKNERNPPQTTEKDSLPVATATETPRVPDTIALPPVATATESVPTVTRAHVQQLIQSLESAKAAIVIQDFKTADLQLAKAATLARLPIQREAVSRLRVVGQHVKTFRQALADAVKEMHAAETFLVGTTRVSFVEGKADAVILRTSGKNETYRFNDMPPGLAIAIADHKLPAKDAGSLIAKGAYLLVNKRADGQSRAKAEALWQEAQASGAEISHLLPFLNDDYSALVKDAVD